MIQLPENHDQSRFTATYSAEDNSIRIYFPEGESRLGDELWELFKDHGYRLAPMLGCYQVKRWTPAREDFAMAVAGDIEAEEQTMAERAEIKAQRLAGYRANRIKDANAYQRSAQYYREKIGNQPILAGHHSQRRAEVAHKRAESAAANVERALSTADYWEYRIAGVANHAEYKHNPRTRYNRIKELLKELRTHQHHLNDLNNRLECWTIASTRDTQEKRDALALHLAGNGGYNEGYSALKNGTLTTQEVIKNNIDRYTRAIESGHNNRWIQHILNRLAYEQAMTGAECPRFDGDLRAPIIQTFLRTHGAEKPKATKTANGWIVRAQAPLPAHIAPDTEDVEFTDMEWRILMQDCGYDVPDSAPRKTIKSTTPLLNLDVETLDTEARYTRNEVETYTVRHMTKAEYMAIGKDYRGTRISTCKKFKFRIGLVGRTAEELAAARAANKYAQQYTYVAVYLTDSKTHAKPE